MSSKNRTIPIGHYVLTPNGTGRVVGIPPNRRWNEYQVVLDGQDPYPWFDNEYFTFSQLIDLGP